MSKRNRDNDKVLAALWVPRWQRDGWQRDLRAASKRLGERITLREVARAAIDSAVSYAAEHYRKDPHAVRLGRKGGKRGGVVRAKRMSKRALSMSARKAALARWRR